jgi:peptidoglycan hydrolase-like protein with peptidoglycan-binding domain
MKKLLLIVLSLLLAGSLMAATQNKNANTNSNGSTNGNKSTNANRKPIFRANADQIKQAQGILKQRSFYSGEQTGKLDTDTRNGLKKYQQAESVKVTGTLNKVTLERSQFISRVFRFAQMSQAASHVHLQPDQSAGAEMLPRALESRESSKLREPDCLLTRCVHIQRRCLPGAFPV